MAAGFRLVHRPVVRALLTVFVAAIAMPAARAQEGSAGSAAPSRLLPEDFGPDGTVTVLGASSFVPRGGAIQGYSGPGYIYRAGGTDSAFWAPVLLPNGVLLTDLCVWYYNTSASGILAEWGAYGLGVTTQPPIYREFSEFFLVPAGGYATTCIAPNTVVRSLADLDEDGFTEWATYRVGIGFSETDDTQQIGGVFLRWTRRVSPAPGAATFNDVPLDDPAFQFIEAFSRANITAGCSAAPPLFCPDASVTRRQMAVFFARALGLHWTE